MRRKPLLSSQRLDELIEEATVDCWNEDEQHAGLCVIVKDNVRCPFRAKVIGEEVEVVGFEEDGSTLDAICRKNGEEYPVEVTSLQWTEALPEGYEWIEAYNAWQSGRWT
jgi:hypothetical protein